MCAIRCVRMALVFALMIIDAMNNVSVLTVKANYTVRKPFLRLDRSFHFYDSDSSPLLLSE